MTRSEAVGLQLFQAMGFSRKEFSAVIITHTSELNQSKQFDTYDHAVHIVKIVYLERAGPGHFNTRCCLNIVFTCRERYTFEKPG